jgi:hypothetical protein
MNGLLTVNRGVFIEINRHKEIDAISRLLDSLHAPSQVISVEGDALLDEARDEALRAVTNILKTYNSDFETICTPPHSD